MTSFGFYDLNVLYNDNIENLYEVWYTKGYRTIAINQYLDVTELQEGKKKKKGEIKVPEPITVSLPKELIGKLTVLNRLTVKVSELSQFPKIFQGKSSIVKKFQIIAVATDEHACFQQACSMNEVDIISVDCKTNKPQWKLSKKLYNIALEQNKFFELCYSPTLRDSSSLKNTIFMAHLLYTVGKSKNVIISSETCDSKFLRSPYEVMYLSLIFGLNTHKARNTITHEPSSLVNRALKRQMGKSSFTIEPL